MTTKEDFLKVWEKFKTMIKEEWRKKSKIEKILYFLLVSVILPWGFGLLIAVSIINPEAGNMVMMFKFMLYSLAVALPFVLAGCMLEFFREDKEKWDEDRKQQREVDRLIEGRIRGRDCASSASDDQGCPST